MRSRGDETSVQQTQRLLCAAVAEILGLRSVSPDDEFLEIGGNSIKAVALTAWARERDLELDVDDIIHCGTIRAMADAIDQRRLAPTAAEAPASGPAQPLLSADDIASVQAQWERLNRSP